MTFVQRQISVTFTLAQGQFQGGGNTMTIQALGPDDPNTPRISAKINGPGGETGITCSLAIWGLPLSSMNQLSVIGKKFGAAYKNTVTVNAGDAISGMQLVFSGDIITAYVDAQAQPQVTFRVEALPGATTAAKNTGATSVKGHADVAQLMGRLASQAGLQFENQGVSVLLRNPYLYGDPISQIKALARAASIEHIVDRGSLRIWKPGSGGGGTINIGVPDMVAYPAFNQTAIILRTIFKPNIKHNDKLSVQSTLTPACGTWAVYQVSHEIEANIPRGKWFSVLYATSVGNDTASS